MNKYIMNELDAHGWNITEPVKSWEFIVKTLNQSFGEEVIQIRTMGGTVPIAPFINELKIPAFIVPVVNPDNNQHSPNENIKIGQLAYGIKSFYSILSTPME